MSDIPDFSKYCEQACRKAWGKPTRETTKELRWTNGDAYGGKTYSKTKKVWYDRDGQVGGSTLDLVAHRKGEPIEKLKGPAFFDAWRKAHELGYVPDQPPPQKEKLLIRRTYPYHDENGDLLYEVVRFDTEDKDRRFRQRRSDGKGGFIWKKGERQVLYRLPDLIEGISQDRPVLLCEGEHDADTARELGYVATTAPGGAEKPWNADYSKVLRGADVIIVSDNDANGRGQRHADMVAHTLHDGVAKRVRIIMFPVKDLSEWIDAGHTREELDALIEAAPDFEAGERRPHERADWATLIGNIIAGRDLHDSTVSMAEAYIASGMDERSATRAIEALFLTSDTPRDERWSARVKDIARAVRTAHGKFAREPERVQTTNLPSGEELKAMHFEPIKYVVRNVIVEGLTLLAAKPKIGKSWLMLHVALAVARGSFTLGEIHCEEGDVLYCALEDNLRRLKSRMSKLLGMDVDWPKRLRFLTEMPRLAEGGIDVIREWIKSAPHPRLVVIDTLAMVRAPKKRDESNYEADYAAAKELRDLANEYGIAIVLVHHLRKADFDDPFDTVSGTLGLTGAPDTILVLKRDTGGNVILHGRGRDLTEIEKALAFNRDACTWTITGSASEARSSRERTAILDVLGAHGEAATPAEIAALAGLKHGSVKHLVLKMAKDGLLKRNDKGRYGLAAVNG